MIIGAVALMAVAFFAFKDQVVTSGASSDTGSIKMTEVVLNLNCPVDQSVLMNLIEVYGDNSCPKITIKRLDLKNNNQTTIEPSFSWLTTFKSSFFPLVKEDLEEDIKGFKNAALTEDVQRLLTTAQGAGADCYYNSVQANFTFKSTQMNSNNLTAYVNKEVAQGKNKVVFKVLKCTVPQKDSDGDGFHDGIDKCPSVFGKINGCPPPPRDRDGDGFPDNQDACPDERGRLRGCPDSDGDGIADDRDKCKDEKGSVKNNGCPATTPVRFRLADDGKTLRFSGGNIGNELFRIQFFDKKDGKSRSSDVFELRPGETEFIISKKALGQLYKSAKIVGRDYQPNQSDRSIQPFTVELRDRNSNRILKQEVWLNCQALN